MVNTNAPPESVGTGSSTPSTFGISIQIPNSFFSSESTALEFGARPSPVIVKQGGVTTTSVPGVHVPGGRQRELPLEYVQQTQPALQIAGLLPHTTLPQYACVT